VRGLQRAEKEYIGINGNPIQPPKSEIVTRQHWHLVKPDTRKEQMP
jgi:hypothetical protein